MAAQSSEPEALGPPSPGGVVVVGASLAGVAVVEQLRSGGYSGSITLVDGETELPYDRPPLSKQFLMGTLPAERLALKPESWFIENRVDRIAGVRAVCLRAAADGLPVVELADGRRLRSEDVVLATGGQAIVPVLEPIDPAEVMTLRTLADAHRLRAALTSGTGRLLILGAGFIGLEIATAAAKLGWRVTVVDRAEAPLTRVLQPEVVRLCLVDLPADHVEVLCCTSVERLTKDGAGLVAKLSDGTVRQFDEVLGGVGMRPNTEWLVGSGVQVQDGVVCDGQGRTSMPRVWAAGDVACWPNESTGRHRRLEQWQSAKEQGWIVGNAIVGRGENWSAPPYFWTELFGRRIQVVGDCGPELAVRTFTDDRNRSISLLDDDGSLRAAVVIGSPRWTAASRRWLSEGVSLQHAAEQAAELVGSGAVPAR